MATSLSTLISWVVSGWKPTVVQTKAWMNSFRHKDDAIAINEVAGLLAAINLKDNTADRVSEIIRIEGLISSISNAPPDSFLLNTNGTRNVTSGFLLAIVLKPTAIAISNVSIGTTLGGNEIYGGEDEMLQGNSFTINVGRELDVNTTLYFSGILTPTNIKIYKK